MNQTISRQALLAYIEKVPTLSPERSEEHLAFQFWDGLITFTQLPEFYTKAIGTADEAKFHIGGTGFYANETNVREYRKKREEDFSRLDNDCSIIKWQFSKPSIVRIVI